MVQITDVELDVSEAVPVGERCAIAGTVFVPDELPERPVVLVAQPGGTYSRRYYDLQPPGYEGYSQARHFAEHGVAFAALDYLGGGDSTRPADGEALTLPVLAAAAHAAFGRLRDGLLDGDFGAPPLVDPIFVALGFSFGGSLTIFQQGEYGDFDAVIIAGFSPIGLDSIQQLPADWDELDEGARREVVRKFNEEAIGQELAVYHGASRYAAHWQAHYGPDVDEALIAYDDADLHTLVPRNAGIDAMTKGFTLGHAQRIDRPVLLCFGASDVTTHPHGEPRAYSASPDVTLAVFPGTSHLYNFGATRRQVWDRMLRWLGGLA